MLRLCRVHWNGDSLEVHGTNPQWEHLAIDDTWDADPAGLPVVNVAGVPDIGCAPSQPDLSSVPRATLALAPSESSLWSLVPRCADGHGAIRQLVEFADVSSGARAGPCRVPPEAALRVAQLLEAIYQSSEEGRRVECDIGGDVE